MVAAAGFGVAVACTDMAVQTSGMRVDGVKVDCAARADGVNKCAPVADACDVTTVLWPPNHKMQRFTLDDCAPPAGCGGGGSGSDGGGSGSGSGSGSDGGGSGSGSGSGSDVIIERTLSPAVAAGTHITAITVDEAIDVGKGGDGHTTVSDIAIIDDVTFDLRSERQGGGDGRVYRVHFVDDAGVEGACEFQVPHDQGPTAGAMDSGTVVTVAP
ncbi:MAG TPA: hypothetical protein VLM79_37665 [Kofleriaceae bacterium]|nr:hypothetical protein [Kofleriaceae bacterium]